MITKRANNLLTFLKAKSVQDPMKYTKLKDLYTRVASTPEGKAQIQAMNYGIKPMTNKYQQYLIQRGADRFFANAKRMGVNTEWVL